MNLFDLLTRKNNVPDYTKNMPPLQPVATGEQALPLVQVDMNGALAENTNTQPQINKIPETKPQNKTTSFGSKLANALFGKSAEPTDNINTENPLLTKITAQTDDWKKQGISDEAIQGVSQGLNSGNKILEQFINDNQIKTPKTDEEIALAKEGKFNDYTPISSTISENPRSGGIFKDIASGYNENRFNPISMSNLMPNKDKNFAYRLGEGLGSLARFAVSPAGRGLGVAGAIGLTGGTLDDVLAYGVNTAAQNQANRMNNQIYRNDLIETKRQALMNDPNFNSLSGQEQQQILNALKQDPNYIKATEEQQNQMEEQAVKDYLTAKQAQQFKEIEASVLRPRGYMNNQTYSNLINSQQLRDNAAYRKMFYDAQQANLREQMELRKQQAKANEEQQKFNRWYQTASLDEKRAERADRRAYNNAQLGLGYARLNNDNYNKALDRDAKNQKEFEKANKGSIDILNQIGTIRKMLKQNPDAVGLWKGNTPGWLINRTDTKGVETRTAIDDLRTYIRHELTGAQFSPAEAREYERFLPTTKDTPSIINAKLNALEKKLNAKIYGQSNTKKGGLAF